ncbi:MAG: hypothetical protein V7K69_12605 [Nostoc sp.]
MDKALQLRSLLHSLFFTIVRSLAASITKTCAIASRIICPERFL